MAVLFLKKTWPIWLVATVLFVSGVFVVHASSTKDPFLSEQWYLKSIHVPTDPQVGKETIVAVLDAGFDMKHEDLINQYWTNTGEVSGDHKDNDHNGYEDDVHGWDFVDGDSDPSPDVSDPNADDTIVSHGTLLAGIIAAQANNGKGIVGIAPNTKIMPLRILDSHGKGTTAEEKDAITYAVKNGADVINLSLASLKPDDQLQQVIEWAVDQGVVVVAAVGNDASDLDRDPTFPACFDTRIGKNSVIGVAALDQAGKKAAFSNDGTNCVDIAAPGVNIFGAVYHDDSNLLYSTSYGSPFEGTSIAAPMVSAAVARLRSAYPLLTPNQIRLSLMLSADPILQEPLEERKRLGAGSLNIERALATAAVFAGTVQQSDAVINTNLHPSHSLVIAQGSGASPVVKRVDGSGKELVSFLAYDKNFHGGVRVAAGDVNGDGTEEIITATGPGGGPQVRVFNLNGKLLSQFFAFDASDRHGIFVATGDVNHDGVDEILVTQDQGGNGQVRIFSLRGEVIGSFYPFGRTTTPVFVSVGNFDEDPESEIVTSLGGVDKSHRIKIFDANGRYLRDFTALTSAKSGLRVSTLHTRDQKIDRILVASVSRSAPWLAIVDATGKFLHSNMVLPQNFLGGVQAIAADLNQNGTVEIYTAPVSLGGPQIRVFDSALSIVGGFFTFDKANRNGLSIAVWNP
ncbi:MAG: S8 family serine peptidase [Candidatus Uhrbacteria bacterium]|nr:S8 family serine peptidase [Candidatus Uhrbacteria bacterium]